jgi:hypothetical protein
LDEECCGSLIQRFDEAALIQRLDQIVVDERVRISCVGLTVVGL